MNSWNLLSPHRWRLNRVGLVVILLACVCAGVVVQAENWPGWRGPAGTGHTTETNLPLFWDGQTGSNVLWKVPSGGIGHSSPVVWDDYVFLTTSAPQPVEQKGKLMPEHHVMAFRVSDGKQLWRTSIAPGKSLCQWHEYAAPTPATDGKALYVWFSSGVAAAVNFEGDLLWREQRDGVSIASDLLNPVSASPVLFGSTVIIKYHHGDADKRGILQALDKTTGKMNCERKLAKTASVSTPILIDINGNKQLVVSSRGVVEGFNPENGTPIWSVSIQKGTEAASPVYDRDTGLLFVSGGPMAIDPRGNGDLMASNVRAFFQNYASGMYPSPVIAMGQVYCNPEFKKKLQCWNWKTGERVYDEDIKSMPDYVSAIATANGLLYYVSAGTSVIVRAGPKFELVAVNNLGGGDAQCGPSAAISNGRIFVRDFEFLYCVGQPTP